MIKLKSICKTFDDQQIIKNLDLEVKEGEFVSLLGPSGCGKSTTLKLITGILEPEEGDILLDGQSLLGIPIDKRETLLVFQDYVLFPHMTVEKNIDFGLRMRKLNKGQRREKVAEMLELVNMSGYEKSYPSDLSGGQRQRVAIARALAVNPKVLLLDEPFSSLDRQLRIETRDFIRELQIKMGITTILVTHDQEEAWMVSDRVAIMLDGQVMQYDSPEKIYKYPKSEEVGVFLGNTNFFEGKVHAGKLELPFVSLSTEHSDGSAKVMIRRENVKIYPKIGTDTDVAGQVIKKSFGGQNVYYQVKVKDAILEGIGMAEELYTLGTQVGVEIDSNQVHYFRNE